jgi:hypothetical protein
MSESILMKRDSIENQVAKPSENNGFVIPQKHQRLVEKAFGPMSFDEKIMGGNKIKNVPIIAEAKLILYVSIYYESLRRKYPCPKIIVK